MATFVWPPGAPVSVAIDAQGLNGTTAPLYSLEVGGKDSSGNLQPLAVEAGQLQVDCTQDGPWDIRNITGTVSLPTGASTSALQTTGNNSLSNIDTKLTSTVDANNSSTTPLAASGVFTGTATDISNYGTVSVLVASDVAAAASGFSFQFSNDGTNWDHTHNFDFNGGSLSYNISSEAKYFRLVFTNGGSPQTYFRLQTVLHRPYIAPSQYTVSQTLTDYALSTVTKGVIYGKTTGGGGGYVAVKVNPSGALTTETSVTSSVLPTDAATETTLSALNTKVPANLTVSSTRLLVDGSGVTQPVSAASLPLPTGASTSALQSSVQGSATGGTAATASSLSGGIYNSAAPTLTNGQQAGLQLDSSGNLKIAGTISATNTANGNTGSAVPVQATQVGGSDGTNLRAIKVSSAGVVSVDGSATTQPVAQTGRTKANTPVFNDYSSTNVTTSAYVQLVASTTSACTAVEVYNQSSSSIYFATGAAASEVNQFIIPPGGNGMVPITIASATRISVKAVDANATAGSLIVNFWS